MSSGSHKPVRVLILRTSRFMGLAVEWARREWPGATIRVVHQPGTEDELRAAGIGVTDRIRMRPHDRITALALWSSRWGWAAWWWRPDHVVVQWWNIDGRGHAAADRAALLLQSRGFHVVMEDRSSQWMPRSRWQSRASSLVSRRCAGAAMVIGIVIATVVLWPITAWRRMTPAR